MKILILGASGFCGSFLKTCLAEKGYDIKGTYRRFRQRYCREPDMIPFSLEEGEILYGILQRTKPDIILSCLRGDFEKQLKAHEMLSDYVRKNQKKLIYFSSANVFDGALEGPHYEEEPVCPKSPYGQFKAACENIIKDRAGKQWVILRLPMILEKCCPRIAEMKEKNSIGESFPVSKNVFLNFISAAQIGTYIDCIIKKDMVGIIHIGTRELWEHRSFFRELAKGLGLANLNFQNIEAPLEPEYLAILSHREEFPESLHWSAARLLSYLTNSDR